MLLTAQHSAADKLVYTKIREVMGGSLEWTVCGGAPLGDRLSEFFNGIGLKTREGYGMTEATGATSVNLPHDNRIGTVGPPLPGSECRISPTGEIEFRGPNIFRGYHNDPEATAACFDDGWFTTGDLGSIDDDGYVSITGRAKEIIVTAGGKNVAPNVLEDRLRGHPLIDQPLVVGDGRPFIAALITVDASMLPGWLAGHNKPPLTVEQAMTDPDVLASLQRAIDRANMAVSRAESIRAFRVIPTTFSEVNGYLTPSLKVRRGPVLRDFAHVIDDLYATAAREHAAELERHEHEDHPEQAGQTQPTEN